ncbi:MAG: NUDIX domain-containing protein [Terrimicrobiaceae bacterium]
MHIPEPIYKDIIAFLPILCVDLLILHENRCLLLRRTNEPALGQYWFPGGRVHKYEKLVDATARIAKEETGLSCNFREIVSVEETIFLRNESRTLEGDKHTINICCKMKLTSAPDIVRLDTYHDAFKWVNRIDLDFHEAVRHPLSLTGFR